MTRNVVALSLCFLIVGCYNPINQVTADRYADTCSEAEASGRMGVAEEACKRALINARIGHLGAEEESKSLYNFARIKQQLGKVEEAEELLKESLKLEEAISPPNQARIGRRLTNLSIVVGAQHRFKDAWPYLERLMPLAMQYEGRERQVVKTVFERYAEEYLKMGMQPESTQLQEKAKSL
ncbi:MAG: tetratricopeptide repeat protein [Nitrosomonadales bacterium]|nr:tetratricopeptide repeat protein [Nitrosomonadales bacterium]